LDLTQVGPAARLLSLSLAYRKRALPLCWSVHRGVKGHVQAEHAITLLEQIRPLLAPDAEVWVLGDSGFGQIELMHSLRARGWHFVLRLHGHYSVQTPSAGWVRLCDHRLREAETRALGRVALTAKHGYRGAHVVLHWAAGEEEPWYLASDQPLGHTMVRHYRRRMWTEELYGDLKGHGFNLEATHLRAPERLERLILGVCLAYTDFWCWGRGSSSGVCATWSIASTGATRATSASAGTTWPIVYDSENLCPPSDFNPVSESDGWLDVFFLNRPRAQYVR
jgi:hypothetical protein